MKPSAGRVVLANYPHHFDVPARFSDLDPLRHLNNVAIGNFYEEGRTAFNRVVFRKIRARSGIRMMMVNVNISYLRQGRYPGVLQVGTGVVRVGTSSFTLGQGLFQEGQCIGVCDSVTVTAGDGASAPLSDEHRQALEELRLEQGVARMSEVGA